MAGSQSSGCVASNFSSQMCLASGSRTATTCTAAPGRSRDSIPIEDRTTRYELRSRAAAFHKIVGFFCEFQPLGGIFARNEPLLHDPTMTGIETVSSVRAHQFVDSALREASRQIGCVQTWQKSCRSPLGRKRTSSFLQSRRAASQRRQLRLETYPRLEGYLRSASFSWPAF